ncbi:MAG TPA: hypothetical protein VFF68_13990 [Anaerolineaceae bacterium]|nr:hypothetical protein [Anaerolineaceae bacterium]
MVRAFLEGLMGQWGVNLLDFYAANSLWINLLVLVYGAWVVSSWVNLKSIRRLLIGALEEQMQGRPEFAKGDVPPKALASLIIPWERAVADARFPFVAQQTDLLPHRKTIDTVRRMLPGDQITQDALDNFRLRSKKTA